MVIVLVFSVWIRRLRPIFPLSQVELCLAVRERWLTAANRQSSISLLGNHAEFLLSRSTSPSNTLLVSLALWFLLEEKKTSTNRQNSKVSWHSIVDQSVRIDLPVFGRSAASGRSGWHRDFLSNRKYRYRPYTQPDVGNCWPCRSTKGEAPWVGRPHAGGTEGTTGSGCQGHWWGAARRRFGAHDAWCVSDLGEQRGGLATQNDGVSGAQQGAHLSWRGRCQQTGARDRSRRLGGREEERASTPEILSSRSWTITRSTRLRILDFSAWSWSPGLTSSMPQYSKSTSKEERRIEACA